MGAGGRAGERVLEVRGRVRGVHAELESRGVDEVWVVWRDVLEVS